MAVAASSCASCKYWKQIILTKTEIAEMSLPSATYAVVGYCRNLAPTNVTKINPWPIVSGDAWCGVWTVG